MMGVGRGETKAQPWTPSPGQRSCPVGIKWMDGYERAKELMRSTPAMLPPPVIPVSSPVSSVLMSPLTPSTTSVSPLHPIPSQYNHSHTAVPVFPISHNVTYCLPKFPQ